MIILNEERQLYVVPSFDGGYSCLNFDVALTRANAFATWLRAQGLQADDLLDCTQERIQVYKAYEMLLQRVVNYCYCNDAYCPVELTPQLVGLEGKRVEVVDCHGQRRRFQVGKSSGVIPVHLELARSTSTGGSVVTGAPFQSVRIVR